MRVFSYWQATNRLRQLSYIQRYAAQRNGLCCGRGLTVRLSLLILVIKLLTLVTEELKFSQTKCHGEIPVRVNPAWAAYT